MPYTYILHSATIKRYYVGATRLTPEARLSYHMSDHKGYTSKSKDWQIVFQIESETIEESLLLERKIKRRGAKRYLDNN